MGAVQPLDVHERETIIPPPQDDAVDVHGQDTIPAPPPVESAVMPVAERFTPDEEPSQVIPVDTEATAEQVALPLEVVADDYDGYDLPLCPFLAGVDPNRGWEKTPARQAPSNDYLPPNHDPATITGTTVLGVYVKEYLGRRPKSNRHLFRIKCELCGEEGEREGRQIVRQRQPGCGCRMNTRHDLGKR